MSYVVYRFSKTFFLDGDGVMDGIFCTHVCIFIRIFVCVYVGRIMFIIFLWCTYVEYDIFW